jgi:hypothetical protein
MGRAPAGAPGCRPLPVARSPLPRRPPRWAGLTRWLQKGGRGLRGSRPARPRAPPRSATASAPAAALRRHYRSRLRQQALRRGARHAAAGVRGPLAERAQRARPGERATLQAGCCPPRVARNGVAFDRWMQVCRVLTKSPCKGFRDSAKNRQPALPVTGLRKTEGTNQTRKLGPRTPGTHAVKCSSRGVCDSARPHGAQPPGLRPPTCQQGRTASPRNMQRSLTQ